MALNQNLEQVREHIQQGLADPDPKRRMMATACFLIDALCLRVGDEKDPDDPIAQVSYGGLTWVQIQPVDSPAAAQSLASILAAGSIVCD